LQELALAHLRPWRYDVLQRAMQRVRARPRSKARQLCQQVQEALDAAQLSARAAEREVTLPSLYRQMRDARASFAQICDQCALRIIAATPLECYTVLGVLHQRYKPLLGRFKDYIAIPKSNGYQSLHTELAGPPGITLQVQIRTEAMDLVAEHGVTAHWMHRAALRTAAPQGGAPAEDAPWLQSMLEIQHETSDAFEFWENIRAGLTEDAVYVFTPRGRVLALPHGATPIDFAYAIHTGIGDRAVGASINGEAAPLSQQLAGGDVVEIVTDPGARPQPDWLDFVRTGRARSHIRSQLKERAQSEIRVLGECLLMQALRAEGLPDVSEEQRAAVRDEVLRFAGKRTREELFDDIGTGRTSASVLARQMAVLLLGAGVRADAVTLTRERFGKRGGMERDAVPLDGSPDVRIHYARCCRPIPGDAVLGYLTPGEGLLVHTEGCPVAQELQRKDPERFIPVAWGEPRRPFTADIAVIVSNAVGVLAGVTAVLAEDGVDITRIHMDDDVSQQNVLEIDFTVAVKDLAHLQHILRHLRHTPSVQRAERCAPAPEKSA
ncbi:MAG: bifunctional (p)ppGpp synthetase/guanosine-3',5'-bis(diphosphate) 3'-pyrophosphohydrolase, partial [Ottowia sp.]|nr:bifunctional (p)ppGpp synthetase/guanosine-3',5'-bis(diphosphate) 3'-pyrophosphohydrolase [Ottowia sp.]